MHASVRNMKRRTVVERDQSDSDFETPTSETKSVVAIAEPTKANRASAPQMMIVERAKSGRAECKKCGEKIPFQDIRIGIVTEGDWGLFTRWQHLGCTIFDLRTSAEEISGYLDLDLPSQTAVRTRMAETVNDIDNEMLPVEPDELVRKDWSISVEPSGDLLMPLLPYQKEGLGWMIHQEQTQPHGGILADEMGMGKAQPLESLVLSPSGWRMIQDLRNGDLVIGSSGKPVRVTGTYPQGVRETYKVEFCDGCGIEVSDHHLWLVYESETDPLPSVLSTLDLFHRSNLLKKNPSIGNQLGRIPIVKPVQFFSGSLDLKVDPYTLGVFLPALDHSPSGKLSITFPCGDLNHYGKLLQFGRHNWSYHQTNEGFVELTVEESFRSYLSEFLTPLRNSTLLAIPSELKMASVSQRVAFLQGLLDISPAEDGTILELGPPLQGDVTDIVRSVGGLAFQDPSGLHLTLHFESTLIPFLSPSKQRGTSTISPPCRYISKISPLRKTEVMCISVDAADHLYVTENFIVTHNTIQSIALLLSHRPQDNANLLSEWEKSDSSHGFKSKSRGKTLIILPTVALRQWQAEIARFTKPGALSVLCYHGNTRSSEDPLHALSEVDVVLTSYKILEIEYRKATAGSKIECSVCGKKFYPEKLRIHRKYFCGENSHRTSAQSLTERKSSSKTRGEDVQTSSSEESEEESEAEIDRKKSAAKKKRGAPQKAQKKKVAEQRATKKGGKGDVGKKNEKAAESTNRLGKGREKEASNDEKIVVKGKRKASSSPAASKLTKKRKAKGEPSSSDSESESGESEEWFDEEVEKQIVAASKADQKKMIPSLLHSVSWFRVICDEAHMIKDRSTSTAKAVFNLVSLNKWCLTGTPLQNRVGELYSLVRFLRIDPFAFYFCKAKGCTCKSLHYRFTKGLCDDCDHSAMQHFCHFNKHVLNPIKRAGYVGEGRRAMLKLKDEVLDKILLRRTKTTRSDDIQLPPRIVNIRMESLDEQEDDFYQALYTQSQAQFNTYVNAGTVLNNYAHIFDILIRLRQVVDHPYLVLFGKHSSENANGPQLNDATEVLCGLCHETPTDARQSRCHHVFCQGCICDFLQIESADTAALCPLCSSPLSIDLEQSEDPHSNEVWGRGAKLGRRNFLRHINVERFQSSTKLEALMQELYLMKLADYGAKALVFSQFVNFLDILEHRIQREGMTCAKLVGSMTVDARDKMIKSFNADPEVSVLLVSLKAGGVALNLTAANYIFVMDPWWNPAAEMQAIDRTHRIGQHKPIHAVRFIIQDTIEERILQLQEKKKLVFDGTIGGDAASMAKLTVDDLRFLFQ